MIVMEVRRYKIHIWKFFLSVCLVFVLFLWHNICVQKEAHVFFKKDILKFLKFK